ncbi:hypothetical protein B0J17DRAFT_628928 [Rhizoctonia solani]|nr:hypothetical protein B0J17DRAFT_628928 [Rhizoctonia solani]
MACFGSAGLFRKMEHRSQRGGTVSYNESKSDTEAVFSKCELLAEVTGRVNAKGTRKKGVLLNSGTRAQPMPCIAAVTQARKGKTIAVGDKGDSLTLAASTKSFDSAMPKDCLSYKQWVQACKIWKVWLRYNIAVHTATHANKCINPATFQSMIFNDLLTQYTIDSASSMATHSQGTWYTAKPRSCLTKPPSTPSSSRHPQGPNPNGLCF